MNRVCAIIVAYNPNQKIIELIESCRDQFTNTVVVNNGMNGQIGRDDIIAQFPHVDLVEMHGNKGVAAALNRGIERAVELEAEYVVTFDQDSKVTSDFAMELILTHKQLVSAGYDVGIVCPIYLDVNSKEYSTQLIFKKYTFERRKLPKNKVDQITFAITSGSLMPISLFYRIGKFTEEMFIDYVDNEFCLRMNEKGIAVYMNANVVMEHSLGERTEFSLGRLKIFPTNHSVMRKYYISRNRLYCIRRYGLSMPSFVVFEIMAIAKDILRVSLLERQKGEKLKSIVRGFRDGLSFKPSWDYQ